MNEIICNGLSEFNIIQLLKIIGPLISYLNWQSYAESISNKYFSIKMCIVNLNVHYKGTQKYSKLW